MSEPTENNIINALKGGGTWNGPINYGNFLNITYNFPDVAAEYYGSALTFLGITTVAGYFQYRDADLVTVTSLSTRQQEATRLAMDSWEAIANVRFNPSANGDIALLNVSLNTPREYAFTNGGLGSLGQADANGDIWINIHTGSSVATNNLTQLAYGQQGFLTLLHELGHALGLKHPGDYSSLGSRGDVPPFLSANDDQRHSVMSYNGFSSDWLPSKPMLYDIAAIQFLYGANPSTNAGNNTYEFKADKLDAIQAIWDAGGADTIDASEQTTRVTINLNPGHFSFVGNNEGSSHSQIAIAFQPVDADYHGIAAYDNNYIENALGGSGNDKLIGNDGVNELTGGDGKDTLEGGKGDDTLKGGQGYDTYIYHTGDGNDTITDEAGSGQLLVDNHLLVARHAQNDPANVYKTADGDTLSLAGSTLTITLPSNGGSIAVSNFSRTTNNLGIELKDESIAYNSSENNSLFFDALAKMDIGAIDFVMAPAYAAPTNCPLAL